MPCRCNGTGVIGTRTVTQVSGANVYGYVLTACPCGKTPILPVVPGAVSL
jgi:hypothetical protein